MASIVTRIRKDGRRSHHIKYRAGDGKVRWEHVPADKKTALARKRAIEDELFATPLATARRDDALRIRTVGLRSTPGRTSSRGSSRTTRATSACTSSRRSARST